MARRMLQLTVVVNTSSTNHEIEQRIEAALRPCCVNNPVVSIGYDSSRDPNSADYVPSVG